MKRLYILFALLLLSNVSIPYDEKSTIDYFKNKKVSIYKYPILLSVNIWKRAIGLADEDLKYFEIIKDKIQILNISDINFSKKGLENINKLEKLEFLDISIKTFDDSCISYIIDKPIKQLRLTKTSVTSNSFKGISKIKSLELLEVFYININNEDIKYLVDLPKLQYLFISNSNLDDEGLRYISKIKNLHSLEIATTNITDKGADYLKQMKNLKHIYIGGTNVSKDKIDELILYFKKNNQIIEDFRHNYIN